MDTDYIFFEYTPNKSKIVGFFDPDDRNIYINRYMGVIKQKLTLIHESKHKHCFLTKCFCWNHSGCFWSEYHAYRAELEFVVAKNTKQYWIQYFRIAVEELDKLISNIDSIDSWRGHFLARRKVCLLKDSVANAKKYGYWKEIEKQLKRVPKHRGNFLKER